MSAVTKRLSYQADPAILDILRAARTPAGAWHALLKHKAASEGMQWSEDEKSDFEWWAQLFDIPDRGYADAHTLVRCDLATLIEAGVAQDVAFAVLHPGFWFLDTSKPILAPVAMPAPARPETPPLKHICLTDDLDAAGKEATEPQAAEKEEHAKAKPSTFCRLRKLLRIPC